MTPPPHPTKAQPAVRIVQLHPRESKCGVCGCKLLNPAYWVAMFEGQPVNTDQTDEWAGFDACQRCADTYEPDSAFWTTAGRVDAVTEAGRMAASKEQHDSLSENMA